MQKLLLLFTFFICFGNLSGQTAIEGDAYGDSIRYRTFVWKVHPFSDSMRTDSTRSMLRSLYTPLFNKTPLPRNEDPLSPFLNLVYKKNTISKTWFFMISLCIILLVVVNRSLFQALFYARYHALYSRSRFNDLLANMKTNAGPSSIMSVLTAQAVIAQLIVIWFIASGYTQLANNPLFFLVLLILLLLWRFGLFLTQSLHCYILDLSPMHRIITLFKTNFELFAGILLIPLALVLYFNVEPLEHPWVGPMLLYLLLFLLLMRISISVVMQIRYGYFNFFGVLYFYALEILPHLLLYSFIRQTLT
ncbi:MAG: DUF4271 domain-containing protein [Bacteroidetes bacterium]|nr:DUF4271 domain-containing protein [Bacteroidota bacterium]